ncbi:MAG: hypothetical protein Kow0099_31720 [Candidatus Abyssubacteria bacterium]
MKRTLKIGLWYVALLAGTSYGAVQLTGPGALLRHAASVKPYAPIFDPAPLREPASATGNIVIFFGDSSVAQPPWAEPDAPGIPALLQTELAGCRVVDWSYSAAALFDYYCLLFEARKHSPALVVIPINWRNLGPLSWERGTRPAFPELSAAVPLDGPSSRPLHSWGIHRSHQLASRAGRPLVYLTGLRAFARNKSGRAPHDSARFDSAPPPGELITYLSDARLFGTYSHVDPTDEQVEALRLLARVSRHHGGPRLLLYITPIHIEEMRTRNAHKTEAVLHSIAALTEALAAEGVKCVNLAAILSERDFIDTAEHYTAAGNRAIAEALAPEVRRLLRSSDAPFPLTNLGERELWAERHHSQGTKAGL